MAASGGDGCYEEQRLKVISILKKLGLDESIRKSYPQLLNEGRR